MNKYEVVKKYIEDNFDNTVRFNPNDVDNLIGLPFKYTVPSMKGIFNELYYWDTYFTNKGLLLCNKVDLAKCNCNNMAYLIEKYGHVPNGNRTYLVTNSQPPYFGLMVYDVYEITKDKKWLNDMYKAIVKEYDFWKIKRNSKTGLNKYGNDNKIEATLSMVDYALTRVKIDLNIGSREYIGNNMYAEAESGWDFTPRFSSRGNEYNPIDLNSLLYRYEILLDTIEKELDIKSNTNWLELANNRKELVNKLLFDKERNIYNDYDFINNKLSKVISAASFWPYYCGLADNNIDPLKNALKALEKEYGLSACDSYPDYQWGYDKLWAPLNFVAIMSLEKYGLHDDAIRLAKKYLDLVANSFEKTGGLWEKYEASTGKVVEGIEYETPQMLGWTAGTYLAVYDYIKNLNVI